MNKKVEKIVGRALVASLAAGVAASVPAKAEELTVDQLYAQAYKATINALNLKTQASINEARAAIKLLPAKLNWAVGEFSKQVDTVQGPKLSAIVRAINAAKASLKQADVDAARTLIEPELPAIWRNSYSSGLDLVQDAVNAKVIAARDKAIASQAKADFDAAQALVNELKASKNANVVKYGETIEAQLKAGLKIAIESYAGVSLTEVVVNFSKAVDSASVNKDNFKVAGAKEKVLAVELSADGKSVVVTTADQYKQQDKVKVTLAGLKDLDGNALAEATVEATIFDVTIPQAVKAEQVGPSKIKVTFSEPIDKNAVSAANLKVDGGQYFISTIAVAGKTVTFDLYATLPVGEHKVNVTGVKDLQGYSVVDTELKFNAFTDTVKPAYSKVVKANPNVVVLEFTENIEEVDFTTTKFYHTNTNNVAKAVKIVNGNQLELDFSTNPLPNGTAYLYIAKEVVKDGWANKNDEIKGLALNVTVDTTKPEIKEVKATSDTVIEITYTEAISNGKYTLLDGAGKEVTTGKTVAATAGDKVKITFDKSLPGSTYTLVVEKATDASGNEINKTSVPVSVNDTTAPKIETKGILYGSKKILKVSFDEPMKSEDLLNLGNYQIKGASYLTAYKVTATVADGGKAVLLDFNQDAIDLAGQTLVVGKLRDAVGNATASFTTEVTFTNQDDTGILVDSVKATSKRTVEVKLDDALTSFEADDFALVLASDTTKAVSVGSVTFRNVDGKGIITYTLLSDLDTDATLAGVSTDTIKVKVESDSAKINSANGFGVKVAKGQVSGALADGIAAEFASVAATGDTVTIVFTEAVKADTLSKYTFTVSGKTVVKFEFKEDTNTATLTLNEALTKDQKVTVTQVLDIEDAANGNVTKGLSKEVTAQ